MVYTVMACIIMAYIVMAYIVMANILPPLLVCNVSKPRINLLDAVRYLIVWHPIILTFAHMIVHVLYPHATLLAHHHVQSIGGNGGR